MQSTRMTRIRFLLIVLLLSTVTRSERVQYQDAIDDEAPDRHTRSTDKEPADEAIRQIFRKIAGGSSSVKEDEELVRLVKQGIVQTAYKIQTPAGSIEAAAQRAQKLVSELTVAYTTAIYKSKSSDQAKANFARFRNTVDEIVKFIKNGEFVI